jgi:hypothetical protein
MAFFEEKSNVVKLGSRLAEKFEFGGTVKICPREDLESPRKFICLPPPPPCRRSVSSHSSWWGEGGRRGGVGGSTLLTHKAHIDKTVKTELKMPV